MNSKRLIGLQTATIPASSAAEMLDVYSRLIEELGLTAMEILLERIAGRFWFDHEASPPDSLQRVLKLVQRRGAHLPFVYINPISPEPAIRRTSLAVLKNAISFAAACGLDYVVMHCRGRNFFLSEVEQEKLWQDTVEEISEYARQHNVLLSLENADTLIELRHFANFLHRLAAQNIGITFDVGHTHFRLSKPRWRYFALGALDRCSPFWLFTNLFAHSSYGSLEEFVRTEAPKLNNLHLHDHNGKRDHLPPGQGRLDYSFLRAVPENVALIIEAKYKNLQEIHDCHRYLLKFLA